MPKTIAIVQARMGSQRFPAKSLTALWGDVTLIDLVLMRTLRATQLDEAVLATSDQSIDDPLAQVAINRGVPVFRGDEDDVLNRFCGVLESFSANAIVRICGDNPLVDSLEVDRLVEFFWENQPCDYACNDRLDCGLPDGAGAEIISFQTLLRLSDIVKGEAREHVTLYATENTSDFNVGRLIAKGAMNRPDIRLDVDYPEDAVFIRQLITRLGPDNAPFWSTSELIGTLDQHPELLKLRRDRSAAVTATQG